MSCKDVYLKCDCGSQAVEFKKYSSDNYRDYEISILDAYCSSEFAGVRGRFKRAWKAFFAKPIYYSGIICTDKDKVKKFLTDCLELLEEDSSNN